MNDRTKHIVTAVVCTALGSAISPVAFAQASGASTNNNAAGSGASDRPSTGDMAGNQTAMQTKEMQGGAMGGEADQKVMANLSKLQATPDKAPDGLFVLDNAMGNMFEIQFAQLAQTKAQDQKVKDLAQTIIKDHTMANDQLKTIAQKMGLDLPSDLPASKKQMLAVYSAMQPQDFETCYLLENKALHAKDITSFTDHQKSVKDEDLRKYVAMVLPHLKMHGAEIVAVASDKGYAGPLGGGTASGDMNGGNNAVGMPGDPHDTPAGGRPSRDPTAPANNQNPSNR